MGPLGAPSSLETEELKLSGVFSNGITTTAQISTESEHTQYFACTDASITASGPLSDPFIQVLVSSYGTGTIIISEPA